MAKRSRCCLLPVAAWCLACQTLELLALMSICGDAGMEGEAGSSGNLRGFHLVLQANHEGKKLGVVFSWRRPCLRYSDTGTARRIALFSRFHFRFWYIINFGHARNARCQQGSSGWKLSICSNKEKTSSSWKPSKRSWNNFVKPSSSGCTFGGNQRAAPV